MSSQLLFQVCAWSRVLALAAVWAATAALQSAAYVLHHAVDWLLTPAARRVPRPGDVVLVTGASSGIGESVALYLQRKGFQVFAGVRKQRDFDRLGQLGLRPIRLDVNDADQVRKAVADIEEFLAQGGGQAAFAALLCNAGVCVAGPLEDQPEEAVRDMVDTNLLGAALVARAFLPLMRRHASRLIFTGSVSGYLPQSGAAVYTATKFGVRGLGLSLAQELRPVGVSVSVVEPAPTSTPIIDKAQAALERMRCSPAYDGLVRLVDVYQRVLIRIVAIEPRLSSDYALYAALTSKYPALEYRTSWTAALLQWLGTFPAELAAGALVTTAYRAAYGLSQGWTSS